MSCARILAGLVFAVVTYLGAQPRLLAQTYDPRAYTPAPPAEPQGGMFESYIDPNRPLNRAERADDTPASPSDPMAGRSRDSVAGALPSPDGSNPGGSDLDSLLPNRPDRINRRTLGQAGGDNSTSLYSTDQGITTKDSTESSETSTDRVWSDR